MIRPALRFACSKLFGVSENSTFTLTLRVRLRLHPTENFALLGACLEFCLFNNLAPRIKRQRSHLQRKLNVSVVACSSLTSFVALLGAKKKSQLMFCDLNNNLGRRFWDSLYMHDMTSMSNLLHLYYKF